MTAGTWWYCLQHRAVEPYEGCKSATRLGPYRTHGEAVAALERVEERNVAWDEDPRFNDPEEEDDDEDDEDDDMEGWGPFRH